MLINLFLTTDMDLMNADSIYNSTKKRLDRDFDQQAVTPLLVTSPTLYHWTDWAIQQIK